MPKPFETRASGSPESAALLNTIRYAYSDWVVVITLLVSSFAFVSFLVRLLNVGVAQIFFDALLWYRQIIHGLIDYALWFLKFKLTQSTKDFLTIWFMVGGLSARAGAHMRSSEIYFQTLQMGSPEGQNSYRRFRRLTEIPPIVVMCILFWPLVLLYQLIVPHVYWAHTFGKFYTAASTNSPVVAKHDHYRFNLRVLIAVYAVTLFGAAALFFVLNAMLPSVG